MSINKSRDPQPDHSIEILITFVFYLMDSYTRLPDKQIGTAISKYLDILAEHTECDSYLEKFKSTNLMEKKYADPTLQTTSVSNFCCL